MAFTQHERAHIRRYLGFSELWKDRDMRLEGQLDSLPVQSPFAAIQVSTILVSLAAIDAKIQSALLENLDLRVADEATFLGPEQIEALQNGGRSLIMQIAITFDLHPRRDFYGAAMGMGGEIQLG